MAISGLVLGGLALDACARALPTPTPTRLPPTPTPRPKEPTPEPTATPDKAVIWTKDFVRLPPESAGDGGPRAFLTNSDKLFFADDDRPTAFNLTDGKKLWQGEDKGVVYGVEEETVYIVRGYDRRLIALDAKTGGKKWDAVFNFAHFLPPNRAQETKDVQVHSLWITPKTVHLSFVWRGESTFSTMDKKTGEKLWESQRETDILGCTDEIITARQVVYTPSSATNLFGNKENYLFGFNLITGNVMWAEDLNVRSYPSTYLLMASNDRVFFGVGDKPVSPKRFALNVANMASGISQSIGVEVKQIVADTRDTVILGDRDLGLTYAIEISTGKIVWQNDDLVIDQVLGVSKNTMIGRRNSPAFLYGLDPKDGRKPKWRFELPQYSSSSVAKPIIFQDKILYGDGQHLAFLDPETGKQLTKRIALPQEPTYFAPQKNFVLVQTGTATPRIDATSFGTLSAVKI